jgi:ribose transport system ATP-binding protein
MSESGFPDAATPLQEGATAKTEHALEINNLSKSYRHVDALKNVSIHVNKGEVLGLVGENGAGKSTLLKILSGVIKPDGGEILVNGEPVIFEDTMEAAENGVSLVKQEQDIITNLTGAENIFLGREGDLTPFGYFNKERMVDEARRHLEDLGIDLDPGKRASELSFNERQLLEIARSFIIAQEGSSDTPIIFLDEPTSGLEEESRELLFELINDLRDKATFIFVSHELDEVLRVANRTYVLKDGELVDEFSSTEATEEKLRSSMVGRALTTDYYNTEQQLDDSELGDVVMNVDGLEVEDTVGPVSFSLREGEILGVVGVEGSGKESLGRMLYGNMPATSGSIRIRGETLTPTSPSQMKGAGMGYVPKDRKAAGLLLYQPLRYNSSLAIIDDMFGKLPLLDIGRERTASKKAIDELGIKAPGIETFARQLSGGNQQKVVLSRWFVKDSPILVMDNVTRGLDVGAKEDVYELCREFTRQGTSMVFIGDELPEVIGLANRIAIMYKGKIVDIVDAPADDKPTEEELISLMI